MPDSATSNRDRVIAILAALFILGYFLLFSHDSLRTAFTFDDGMAILPFHHQFEKSMWTNAVEVLKVFTNANRPLGAFLYRPIYRIFGFNPLPLRIVLELLMAMNIAIAFLWARAAGAGKEAAALSTLLFCYNASTVDLYYNSATMYDILCFSLYFPAMIIYIRGRVAGSPLSMKRIVWIVLLYLLGLDSKEMAVTLPAALLLFEVIYRHEDLKDRAILLRSGGLIGALSIASAVFLRVKVANLSRVDAYDPHKSITFILSNIGHYFEELLYLPKGFASAAVVCVIFFGLIGTGLLLRSRHTVFGALFFATAIIPVAMIPARSGYAAYVAYPGLTLAIATILAECRSRFVRLARLERWETATAILLFVCAGAGQAIAQNSRRMEAMGYMVWDQSRRNALMEGFRRNVPEFPPNARVLITKDCWDPDWGPMFLLRLLYHNPTLWVDRVKNMDHPPDLKSYDLLVSFKEPYVDLKPAKWFGVNLPWEIRGYDSGGSEFVMSSPNPNRNVPAVSFSPPAVRTGRPVTISVPGLANVRIDVLYRVISGGRSRTEVIGGWCTLDDKGSGMIAAPAVGQEGAIAVDWIRPANERWIYTSGVLMVVE